MAKKVHTVPMHSYLATYACAKHRKSNLPRVLAALSIAGLKSVPLDYAAQACDVP